MKKYIVLAVMLIIPACLFLFLKFQGKNHFQLEVMVPALTVDCLQGNEMPDSTYSIPDFNYIGENESTFSNANLDGGISILHLVSSSGKKNVSEEMNELQRVQSVITDKEEIKLFTLYEDLGNEELKPFTQESDDFWELYFIGNGEIKHFSQCSLGIGAGEATDSDLVLIDKNRQIRGYYDGSEREEIDRLITELQVLEFEYKQKK